MLLSDELNNEVSFEADLKKKWFWFKYRLLNIETSRGFDFEIEKKNRITMQLSTNLRSNRINFQIRGLTKDGKSFVPIADKDHVTQQYEDRGSFRFNSEYIPDANQLTDAYVLPIIDCSLSLGDQTKRAKEIMVEAVDIIVPNKEDSN